MPSAGYLVPRRIMRTLVSWLFIVLSSAAAQAGDELKVLFLGDEGPHRPRERADQLIPVLGACGIDVTYTEDLEQLTLDNLKKFAGLIIYANIDNLPAEQESALLEYVAGGGGFIPLHCASFCFRNSSAYIDLVGAQFQRHGGRVFSTSIVQPEHPIMRGYGGFASWDETYIHTRHNPRGRIVLEVRRIGGQAAGQTEEPWTWVRTHGQGRVFYTAWGHDQRTWGHPGFQNLIRRGIRWACGRDPSAVPDYHDPSVFPVPKMTQPRTDIAAFEYEDVGPKIPNYLAGEKWGTQGEVISKMQKPLSPEESLKHYVVPEGFHLELFVSEPQLQGKPIAMNWDERGRLWVCETIDYPNELRSPEQGRDRIRICEDTDGDGRADKFTVFAEQLSIPTSLEFYRGGVIVQAGVETLFLRDNDGDDRADQRDTLITGWAMGDTHGGVSNFQYGLDNRYWAMQGYNNSKPKFAAGEHQGFRQGPFNFTVAGSTSPRVTQVEFVRSTTNNSWGLGISEEGLIFASTANGAPSFFVPIPNRYYERVRGWTPNLLADAIADNHLFRPITENIRQVDQHGGYTAAAGHALYTARNYPESWWNRVAFVCGPTGHLVGSFVLERDGATFRDSNAFNLLASDDEWSAPIMAEVGPDGNVWIIDWYNYIVQHNPTPQGFERGRGNAYESDLRDKTRGRIYRLVYDGNDSQAGSGASPLLEPQNVSSWVQALQHSNRLWRRHAQRLLVERGKRDIQQQLIRLVDDETVDRVNNNPGAIHALWTLHGLGALDHAAGAAFEAATRALRHPAAGVRRNAALVLPSQPESALAIVQSRLVRDSDAQVQLAALMALADMPTDGRAGELLAALLVEGEMLRDLHLTDAIICAAAAHAVPFLTRLAGEWDEPVQGPGTRQAGVVRVVAEHLARSQPNSAELEQLLTTLAGGDTTYARPLLGGLAAGWPHDRQLSLSTAGQRAVERILERLPPAQRGSLLRLASVWGSESLSEYLHEVSQSLLASIANDQAQPSRRVAAAAELITLAGGEPETVSDLMESITPQMPPVVASGVIRALAGATAESVASELIAVWPSLTPSMRDDALVVMLARPQSTRALLDAIAGGTIVADDLSLDQRQTLRSHPDREIRNAASKLLQATGGLVDADRQRVIDRYLVATHQTGDRLAGKQLFKKNCANCHQHSGEGTQIGPDLTGMAVHPKVELLVHILDPSRSVEGNFRRYTLLTTGGQVLTGMLAAESLSAVELIDAEGKRHSISREDLQQIAASKLSLMPAGFEQQMSVADMTDLLEFLTSKGRFVPLPLGSVATAISTKALFSEADNGPDQMVWSDWSPKEFQGVPFHLVDPQGKRRANMILLNGPRGTLPPSMPKQVALPCNMRIKSLHLLSGVSGWGFPASGGKTPSMIVRFHYEDGQTEDHALLNGVHFADYIRRVDVPESKFAFGLRGQQIRYLAVQPQRQVPILTVQLIKGDDDTAPIVMAITAEQHQ